MKYRFALAGLLLLAGDPFASGVRAYQDGRFRDAFESFATAERDAGDNASPELLFNLAVAALQTGQLRVAEYTAEKLAARGGPDGILSRDFLLANIAFRRGERAAAEANLQGADPTAWARAVRHTRTAVRRWKEIAMLGVGPPQARRNMERAQARLADLEKLQREADTKRQSVKQQDPSTTTNPAGQQPREVEQAPRPQQEPTVSPLALLLSQLEQMQRDKRASRQSQRRSRSANVERDW